MTTFVDLFHPLHTYMSGLGDLAIFPLHVLQPILLKAGGRKVRVLSGGLKRLFDEVNTRLNVSLSHSAFASDNAGLVIAKVIRSSRAWVSITVEGGECIYYNGSELLRDFGPSLASLKHCLHTLVISDMSIEADTLISLSKVLTALTGLHTLELSILGSGETASASLATSLMVLTELRSLNLSYIHIGLKCVASWALSLTTLTCLNSLKLSNNRIEPSGAALLAPSL